MPKFDESDALGRAGVSEVALVISKMRWIFREQSVSDTGIDGHIEVCDQNRNATGKLIGCQVKSGPSYFQETTESAFIYRGNPGHLAYWLGHSLPVIIILRDDESGKCYWQLINDKTATRTGRGWKVEIPKSQVLGEDAKPQLEQIADTGWLERARTFTTPTKFFRRVETNPLFDYDQSLQGRKSSLAELRKFLTDANATVAVLAGRGGIGKSKLIRQWSSEISGWTVLFKKETVSVSATTEQELSSDHYVVIADDAHRQSDIDALLQLVRDLKREGKTIKVLLSCRPIGLQRIDAAISRSFDTTAVSRLKELKRLSHADVRSLADEVLGPEHGQLAPYLVSVSRDTPLVTVIGGRLLRRNPALAAELPGVEIFRRAVFDKFLDDFETVAKRGAQNIRPFLHLISALQPLALRTENVAGSCATFLEWKPFEVCQAIDELESSGLLVRSGHMYRIAPDMFADFLLEQASISATGTSNEYADAVYSSFGNEYLANLLQNLAELDFRTVDQGHPSLLKNIWKDLRSKFEKAENSEKVQLLKSIEPAAFHQPASVMDLVRQTMQEVSPPPEADIAAEMIFRYSQEDVLNALPPLLRDVAYHPPYRDEAVRCLWDLAKQDYREPGSHPEHALRALKSLAAYSRYKPVNFNLDIARTVRALCSQADAFKGKRTPLDIVDELLKREGEEQESLGMKVVLSWFGLNYAVIAPVRKVCLQTLQECLHSNDIAKACRAFRSLSTLIHGFLSKHSVSDDEEQWHSNERQTCLSIVIQKLAAGDTPLPLAQQIKAALERFVARGQNEKTNDRVREVLAMLPITANLAAFDAFCTGDWDIRESGSTEVDISTAMERNRQRSRDAAVSLRKGFATVDDCISELARFFVLAREGNISPDGANELVHHLCDESELLTKLGEQIRNATCRRELAITAQVVIRRLRERGGPEYLSTGLAAAGSDDLVLVRSAAAAMWGIPYDTATDDDLRMLDDLARHPDLYVRETVVRTLWLVGKHPARAQDAISRILSLSLGEDKKLAGTMCEAFLYDRIPLHSLSEGQLDKLLQNLVPISDLDEHGIGMVLNWVVNNNPAALIRFLGKRVLRVSERRAAGDWSYRLLPQHQTEIHLDGLKDSDDLSQFRTGLLRQIESEKLSRSELIDLFWSVTVPDEKSFDLLRPWLHSKDISKFDLAVSIFGDSPRNLAFSHRDQVLETLTAAEKFGSERLERVIGHFVSRAHPYFHGGWQRDQSLATEDLRTTAEAALADPQLDPLMRRLYEAIRSSATVNIRPFLDQEDEEEF